MRNKKPESACPKVKQCLEEAQSTQSGSVWAAIRILHAVRRAAHAIISIISSMFLFLLVNCYFILFLYLSLSFFQVDNSKCQYQNCFCMYHTVEIYKCYRCSVQVRSDAVPVLTVYCQQAFSFILCQGCTLDETLFMAFVLLLDCVLFSCQRDT